QRAFLANPALNSLIAGIIGIGIVLNLRQVLMLSPEAEWLESCRRGRMPVSEPAGLRLLAPMARLLTEHRERARLGLSAAAMRSLLDTISSRLEESRDISRYFVGLCIFLGLLGTFWGLLGTVASIGDVIRDLSLTTDDVTSVFSDLKRGLEAPLSGMGTAFSSSLLGLSGSLVLGFLDLQAGQAQNDFFNSLEDWLATQTHLTSGMASGGDGGEPFIPAYIHALLEETAEGLAEFKRSLLQSEDSRIATHVQMHIFADKVSALTDQIRAEQTLLQKLVENQTEMKPVLAKLVDFGQHGAFGFDDATRNHIRNMDNVMTRLAEQSMSERERTINEIRGEIKLLTRTLVGLASDMDR
ncbi:MAG: flagellar motor protein MotA, partial [Alphaproteobacteria bacterium]|nr:flagellar motor protein MotA [Alphaproteobacteria bacterium]